MPGLHLAARGNARDAHHHSSDPARQASWDRAFGANGGHERQGSPAVDSGQDNACRSPPLDPCLILVKFFRVFVGMPLWRKLAARTPTLGW
jgi:hypothetical protein